MDVTILIPHWRIGKTTAYAVAKVVEHSKNHNVKIVVIDNSIGDRSIDHILLTNLRHHCTVIHYPAGLLQSHGIAFDFAIKQGLVQTKYFITLESDSYPTHDRWLDYYEDLVNTHAPDIAGSKLQLSGGEYIHPCGALYKIDGWYAANAYCIGLNGMFYYFPNMIIKEGFKCHAMVRRKMIDEDFGHLNIHVHDSGWAFAEEYDRLQKAQVLEKALTYQPVTGPFHNGMGKLQESITTYGARSLVTGIQDLILGDVDDVVLRIGYEPGQMLSYYLCGAPGFKCMSIPTTGKWLTGRIGQNQEYTIMESGLRHEWGITAFNDQRTDADPAVQAVIDFKMNRLNELYESLPADSKL